MTDLLSFLPAPFDLIASALVIGVILVSFLAGVASVFVWLERKVSGRIQDRLGPTRLGFWGLPQMIADAVKLLAKEDTSPDVADKFLFKIAPYLAFCASFTAFVSLPFGPGIVPYQLNVAAFFILAVLSSEVFGVILAGYASGSKWSLFGGIREAAQVVSYEVPRSMCVLIPVIVAGTLNLNTIGKQQTGFFWEWNMFHDPFTFVAFFMFFIVATASCKRAPFDLAEAESELVAGFHTEYSGLRWSFFFMAEYASMFAVSGAAAILFLGGWHTGFLPFEPANNLGLGRIWDRHHRLHFQGVVPGSSHDVDALVIATIADRSGDDDVLEIFPADVLRSVAGRLRVGIIHPVGRRNRLAISECDCQCPIRCRVDFAAADGAVDDGPRATSRRVGRDRCAHEESRTRCCGGEVSLDLILFAAIASATGLSALAVVFSRNIVRSAVWLLFTLIGVSLLYFLLGAEFVGATQLIVYVGGTMVLVVFGVMLTAQQQFLKIKTRPQEWIVGGVLAVALFVLLANTSMQMGEGKTSPPSEPMPGAGQLGVGFLNTYLLPFEIVSVHLLVVLIGAAYLARAKRRAKEQAAP